MKVLKGLCVLLVLPVWLHGGVSPARSQSTFRVRWVVDGDTIILENNKHVRYLGIDAPEIERKDKKGEPLGEAARAFNKRLVFGKRVRLVFSKERTDRYGRWLAYVYLPDGTLVNAALIEAGFAHVLYQRATGGRFQSFLALQRRAMARKRGIWRHLFSEDPVKLVGNTASKRFHLPTCANAKRIHPQNRKPFKGKWDAFWEGFAPAGCCFSP